MVDLTPIEEYNKKLKESGKEIQKSTDSLRSPFKQLVGRIKETNSEFAKIAADNIGQTQDTWKGLITQGKKEKLIREQENNARFKSASKQIKAQEKNAAEMETKAVEIEKESSQKKKQIEDRYIVERQTALDSDVMGFNSLRGLREKKLNLEIDFENSTDQVKTEIATKLSNLSTEISTRESAITSLLSSKKDTQVAELDKAKEDELKTIEDLTKQGQAATREQQIYVNDINDELERQLERAGKTENYDKFTKGIKTLSGGLIDIEGVLDPVAEQLGALRDVGSVLATPFKGIATKVGSFFKDEKEDLAEQNDELADQNKENLEGQKKSGKSLGSFISKLGISGVLMLALAAAIVVVLAKFTDLDNWLKTLSGNKDEDARDELTELTKVFKENLQKAETIEEKDNLTREFKLKQDELLKQQKDRVEQVRIQDGLALSGDAALIAANSTAGVNATRGVMGVNDAYNNPPQDAINPNTGKVDGRLKANKNPSFWKRFKSAAMKINPKSLALKGNPVTQIVGAGLTGAEIMLELEDMNTAREKIEYLWQNQILTPDEYEQALIDLEKMEKEAYVKPTNMALAGAAATFLVGSVLTATGFGSVPGIALAAGSAGVLAAGLSGIGTDMYYDGDDAVYDLLSSKGYNIDPDVAVDNLEFMQDMGQDTSAMLDSGINNLNDVTGSTSGDSSVTTAVQTNNSNQTNFLGGSTPPQNLDLTNQGLNFSQ